MLNASIIERQAASESVAITASLATTGEIAYSNASSGVFHVATGSSATSLTWYSAPHALADPDSRLGSGTYKAANDQAGTTAITQTVAADKSYPIPTELAGSAFIKAVGNDTATIIVTLKT